VAKNSTVGCRSAFVYANEHFAVYALDERPILRGKAGP
jgi:hypothetical protein